MTDDGCGPMSSCSGVVAGRPAAGEGEVTTAVTGLHCTTRDGCCLLLLLLLVLLVLLPLPLLLL